MRKVFFDDLSMLERIEKHRNERGWTNCFMAAKTGISEAVIESWFKKKAHPGMQEIAKLCVAFRITFSQFFNDKREPVPRKKINWRAEIEKLSPEELKKLAALVKLYYMTYNKYRK